LIELAQTDGFLGHFTKNQAEGAMRNGTRIKKTVYEEGDATAIGQLGRVLGSLPVPPDSIPEGTGPGFFYFVEWDHAPKIAIGVSWLKIGPADD
jgi:hypothetical protein